MSSSIRVAVVGAGYFGRFHAKHLAAHPGAVLSCVVDTDEQRARLASEGLGARPLRDHRALIGQVDAASVVVPTPEHFRVAHDLIEAGIHVLVEKPITDDVETAHTLSQLAKARGVVLQVGHVERFSATYSALADRVTQPLYIESFRVSPWKNRAGEVDVVLDLMIHDIDIIQGLVASPIASVHAVGTPVLNPTEDVANARIVFQSGCVANVTASRISYKTERRLRVFQPDSYIVADFANHRIDAYSLNGDPAVKGLAAIEYQSTEVQPQDSLASEIADFLECIASGRRPRVDGYAGYEALRVASLVTDSIDEHRRRLRQTTQMRFPPQFVDHLALKVH